jgi:flagellar protein FliL
MTEEAAPEAAEGAAPKGKDKAPSAKAPLPVMLLLALNLGATGFGVWKLIQLPTAAAATKAAEGSGSGSGSAEAEKPKTKEVTGPILPLDTFVVNLDEPGTSRYLKVTLQLELFDEKAQAVVEKSKQVVRDELLRHLSGLKLADTLGEKAKDKLRDDMMKILDDTVGADKVRRIFFQEFVVQ